MYTIKGTMRQALVMVFMLRSHQTQRSCQLRGGRNQQSSAVDIDQSFTCYYFFIFFYFHSFPLFFYFFPFLFLCYLLFCCSFNCCFFLSSQFASVFLSASVQQQFTFPNVVNLQFNKHRFENGKQLQVRSSLLVLQTFFTQRHNRVSTISFLITQFYLN